MREGRGGTGRKGEKCREMWQRRGRGNARERLRPHYVFLQTLCPDHPGSYVRTYIKRRSNFVMYTHTLSTLEPTVKSCT